uniref:Uncharacterized protein n=1 Tax=Nothobranchius pienaari TaxID=704102 RepID=A0A1A8QFX4_9TELE
MSDEKCKTLRCSQAWNYVPLGRQLPRTPPMADVKRNLSFLDPDANHSRPDQNNKMKIQKLMSELADLKSGLPEQKVEKKSAEPRAAKSKAKQQERQRKAAEGPQKLITGKSTRRGHVDETNALATIPEENQHQKPGALLESKPLKASTRKPRRVEKEEVPERTAGGRQKPADSRRKATLENNPKESHQESHCGQEAEEQPHYLGLRRSKRIANRK